MLKASIEKLIIRQNLDELTCQKAMVEILASDTSPLQIAAFLVLLKSKMETVKELVAIFNVLKQRMIQVPTSHKVLDIVGTGGDRAGSINISTGSAILAASCGVKVAKHGNRAVSSQAGSADVLEELGVNIHTTPQKVAASIEEIGIGFCFSPHFHPALAALHPLRKQLNIPTVFNLLGPLLNPAQPAHLILGVYDAALLKIMAETLKCLGTQRSFIVHGKGLDEISCVGPTQIFEVTPTECKKFVIKPEKFGLSRCNLADLQGGDARTNAELLLKALSLTSSKNSNAITDTLILNAAVALYLYGLHPSMISAIAHAKENLLSGSALHLLKNWIEFSHEYSA